MLGNEINGPNRKTHHIQSFVFSWVYVLAILLWVYSCNFHFDVLGNIFSTRLKDVDKMESLDCLIVTLLKMESTFTTLLPFYSEQQSWIFLHTRQMDSFILLILILLIDFLTLLQKSCWYLVKMSKQYDRKCTNS